MGASESTSLNEHVKNHLRKRGIADDRTKRDGAITTGTCTGYGISTTKSIPSSISAKDYIKLDYTSISGLILSGFKMEGVNTQKKVRTTLLLVPFGYVSDSGDINIRPDHVLSVTVLNFGNDRIPRHRTSDWGETHLVLTTYAPIISPTPGEGLAGTGINCMVVNDEKTENIERNNFYDPDFDTTHTASMANSVAKYLETFEGDIWAHNESLPEFEF